MFITKVLNKGYQADNCAICNSAFGLVNRIHKCKRCARFVCSGCGKHKEKVVKETGEKSQKPHRICALCSEDMDFIKLTLQNYEMAWATTSNFCRVWIAKIQGKDYDYDNFLRHFHHNKQHYEQAYETIEKDVTLGRTDLTVFNFSMRDFFYRVQSARTKDSTRRSMCNVLCAITGKYTELGYCQGMSSIAAFLLCFGTEVESFNMFCDLIQNILPENLYMKSSQGTNLIGLLAELAFLKEYFIMYMIEVKGKELSPQQIETFETVIEIMGAKCLLTLFIGNLTFINLMFIWNQMVRQRSFQPIQRAMMALMYLFQSKIQQDSTRFKQMQKFIQLIDHSQLKEIYQEITIDPKKRADILSKFYSSFSKQWNANDKMTLRKLEKMCKFTKEELEVIQTKFIQVIDGKVLIGQMQEGLNQAQFLNFITKYMEKGKINFIDKYEHDYFSKIFGNFDQDQNGFLDFREFICCVSALLRGTLRDRLIILSQTLETEQGYIPSKIFAQKLKELVELIHHTAPYDGELNDLQDTFKIKATTFYLQQQKIASSEVFVLINDPFISEATLRTIDKKYEDATIIVECLT